MKIMVVGGGGREHAIIKKLSESEKADKIICAPGNGGIAALAECFDIKATDIDGLCGLARERTVDYVVVAPDDPLALGLVDRLEEMGIPAFGPTAKAAELEASKVFSKGFMQKYGIPTAKYRAFDDMASALEYIEAEGAPIVVKADGLALGKGVTVCSTVEEAKAAVQAMMMDGAFGKAGSQIVIEECLEGPEVTVLCFCDGKLLKPMPSSQDHKRAYDGDMGPNTGGMGAFSPSPNYTEEIAERCMAEIFLPTMDGMIKEGRPFKGVLYVGLMLTADGPKVIEYNARFGDPETQALLPRLKSDLLDIMLATTNGTLDRTDIEWREEAAMCVVLASGGYPGKYETGYEIGGLDKSSGIIYHAGTKLSDGKYLTSGGRVLGVTALGATLKDARDRAYEAAKPISFKNMHMRGDIGAGL